MVVLHVITLLRSMIVFCGTDNFYRIFHHAYWMWGMFCRVLSIPHNIVMDLNNAMVFLLWRNEFYNAWLFKVLLDKHVVCSSHPSSSIVKKIIIKSTKSLGRDYTGEQFFLLFKISSIEKWVASPISSHPRSPKIKATLGQACQKMYEEVIWKWHGILHVQKWNGKLENSMFPIHYPCKLHRWI